MSSFHSWEAFLQSQLDCPGRLHAVQKLLQRSGVSMTPVEKTIGMGSGPAMPKSLPLMGRMRSYSQLKGPMLYFRKGSSQMMWFSTREISLPLQQLPENTDPTLRYSHPPTSLPMH